MGRLHPAGIALTLIGVLGAAISIYLTVVHYAAVPLVCSTSGLVNCERVLSSAYSSVVGVPISAGGLVWFAVLGALGAAGLGAGAEPRWLQPAQVGWALLGLLTAIYLVGVEVLALGVICAWCTALHVLIVTALLISILRAPVGEVEARAEGRDRRLGKGEA